MAEQRSFVCPETDAPCEDPTCRRRDGEITCALETDTRRRAQATAGAREVDRLKQQRAADEEFVQSTEKVYAMGQRLFPHIEEERTAALRRLSGVYRRNSK